VHQEYQTLTHKTKIDTIGLKSRKEGCKEVATAWKKTLLCLAKIIYFVDTKSMPSPFTDRFTIFKT